MAARPRYRSRPQPEPTTQVHNATSSQPLKGRIQWKAVAVAIFLVLVVGCRWMIPARSVLRPAGVDTTPVKAFSVPSTITRTIVEGVRADVVVKRSAGSSVCDEDSSKNKNALVVLAQKKHSTYGRDSLGLLIKTLDLFRDNYLSIGSHRHNVDVFLFHTGDFTNADLIRLENRLMDHDKGIESNGILRLVDLNNTVYWSLPEMLKRDNQTFWKGSEIYPVGYRHMCRWFGMQLFYFFRDLNQQSGCNYRYIARLDEDSFIHSRIEYDIFDLMEAQQYVYAFRCCAFELAETLPKVWFKKWRTSLGNSTWRFLDPNLCGFYTNFFIADLQFFLSSSVTRFLQEIDRKGFYYRKRFGDLLVHSLAVYAFAPPERIHRFLDFTYEHATIDHFKDAEKECISWGAIQAGYNDPRGEQLVDQFYKTHVLDKDCPTANLSYISQQDLSPTYNHLPREKKVILKTVHAGKVELPDQGLLSG